MKLKIESKKINVESSGNSNIAELNLIGKHGGMSTALQSNAKLHIGAHNNSGQLIGGGIGFFTNSDSTSYDINNDFQDNFINFYRSVGETKHIF